MKPITVMSIRLSVALLLGWLLGLFTPWWGNFGEFAAAAVLTLAVVHLMDAILSSSRVEASAKSKKFQKQSRGREASPRRSRRRRSPRGNQEPNASGKINSYKADRSFGFITPDDGGPEVFFHANDIKRGLGSMKPVVGATVKYKAESSDRGPRALVVQLLTERDGA